MIKSVLFFTLISFTACAISYFLLNNYASISEDDLYWLFSTIPQTLGAIVGIIGMLTVYKLQIISTSIKDLTDHTNVLPEELYYSDTYPIDPEHYREKLKNKYSKLFVPASEDVPPVSVEEEQIIIFYNQLDNLLEIRKSIRIRFLFFLVPSISTIAISIGFIPFSDELSLHKPDPLILFILFLTFISLLMSFVLCKYLTQS